MTAWTEQVARPDGTVYRARRGPSVEPFGDDSDRNSGYVVARTHDVDLAVALVTNPWRCDYGDGPLPVPERRWVRIVPWSDAGYDFTWLDARPHERGAIPVVEFRDPWP